MSEMIYFTSLKGGAGATTCAVGVGLALAAAGRRVLVVDGDRNFSAALTISGCAGLQTYSLEEARKGACRIKQVLVGHPRSPNFYLLPCAGCTDRKYANAAAGEVEGGFDYVLCDKAGMNACSRAAVVCEPYPTGIKGADAAINEARDGGIEDVGLIVNRVNGGLIYDGIVPAPSDIAALLRVPLWGVIPEDLNMPLGSMRADSTRAFKLTAMRLAGEGKKVFSPARGYSGPGGYIKRRIRPKI